MTGSWMRIRMLLQADTSVRWTREQIATRIGVTCNAAARALMTMLERGEVERVAYGRYRGVPEPGADPHPWLREPWFLVPPSLLVPPLDEAPSGTAYVTLGHYGEEGGG